MGVGAGDGFGTRVGADVGKGAGLIVGMGAGVEVGVGEGVDLGTGESVGLGLASASGAGVSWVAPDVSGGGVGLSVGLPGRGLGVGTDPRASSRLVSEPAACPLKLFPDALAALLAPLPAEGEPAGSTDVCGED